MNRKLRYNGRKKADAGIILAGVNLGLNAIKGISSLFGANDQAEAARAAAEQQASAIMGAARMQANAMEEQNIQNRANVLTMIDNQKQLIKENRTIQDVSSLNNAISLGDSIEKERNKLSRIALSKGGKVNMSYPLRGFNSKLAVTDGGYLQPLGVTPEGYPMYMTIGNDHEHYHKTKGGKYKSGVGIITPNGEEIELEGNQNTPVGEIVVKTPNNLFALSKHSLAGYNPTKAVLQGEHPLTALTNQEIIKAANGINDNIKAKHGCVRKLRYSDRKKAEFGIWGNGRNDDYRITPWGGMLTIPEPNPYKPIEGIGQTPVPIMPPTQITPPDIVIPQPISTPLSYESSVPIITPDIQGIANPELLTYNGDVGGSTKSSGLFSNWNTGDWLNLAGTGINILSGLGSTFIANKGMKKAASILNDANQQAANTITDAYNRMSGVSTNAISKADFKPAQALAFVAPAYINRNPEIEAINKNLREQIESIRHTTLSSAAATNRINKAILAAQQAKSKIYADITNKEQEQSQKNLSTINSVNVENARLAANANQAFNSAYIDLLKYNNNIENAKIAGIAQAQAGNLQSTGQVNAGLAAQKANNWSNFLTNASEGLSNTINAITTRQDNYNQYVPALASTDEIKARINNNSPADRAYLKNVYNSTQNIYQKNLIAKYLNLPTTNYSSTSTTPLFTPLNKNYTKLNLKPITNIWSINN